MSEELQRLFRLKEIKHEQYKMTQMVNTSGKTPEERVDMDIASERARWDWLDARAEYRKAIEKHITGAGQNE